MPTPLPTRRRRPPGWRGRNPRPGRRHRSAARALFPAVIHALDVAVTILIITAGGLAAGCLVAIAAVGECAAPAPPAGSLDARAAGQLRARPGHPKKPDKGGRGGQQNTRYAYSQP